MDKKWGDLKQSWPLAVIIALGFALTSILTTPLTDFFSSAGVPIWLLIAIGVAIGTLCFAVDIRAAHKRGERFFSPGVEARGHSGISNGVVDAENLGELR